MDYFPLCLKPETQTYLTGCAGKMTALQIAGQVESVLNPDSVRLVLADPATMPQLLKNTFEKHIGRPFDEAILRQQAPVAAGEDW